MKEKNSVNRILKIAEEVFDDTLQKCAVDGEINFDEFDLIVDRIKVLKDRTISLQSSQDFTINQIKKLIKKLNKEKSDEVLDYIS